MILVGLVGALVGVLAWVVSRVPNRTPRQVALDAAAVHMAFKGRASSELVH